MKTPATGKGLHPETKTTASPAKRLKVADPVRASIDEATQTMLRRAQELGIDTVFDRAENMKQCNIGTQGTCCKNCGMGPCRLPLPKSGIEGEDDAKRLVRGVRQHHCRPQLYPHDRWWRCGPFGPWPWCGRSVPECRPQRIPGLQDQGLRQIDGDCTLFRCRDNGIGGWRDRRSRSG